MAFVDTIRLSRLHSVIALAGCICLLNAFAPAQSRHLVTGTVVSFNGGVGVAGAAIQCVVRRDGGRVVVAEGMSRADGSFGVASTPVTEEMELWVSARGHAPLVLKVRSTPEGQGLHIGRVLLERGWSLSVALHVETGAQLPSEVSVVPAAHGSSRVDMNGPRLLRTGVVDGHAVFSNLAAGEYLIVVHDRFKSFVPRVLPWTMGSAARFVPSLVLKRGLTQRLLIHETDDESVSAKCQVGLGVWDRRTGEEYQIAWQVSAAAAGEHRATLALKHLPLALLTSRLQTKSKCGEIETVTGVVEAQTSLQDATRIHGQIREDGSGRALSGAWIQVGARRIACNAEGHFEAIGFAPGPFWAYAGASTHLTSKRRRILISGNQSAYRLNLYCKPSAQLDGVVRFAGRIEKQAPLISVERSSSDTRRVGHLVWGSCRPDGTFAIKGIPTGSVRVRAVRLPDAFSETHQISVSSRDPNRVWLDTRPCGQVKGVLRHEDGTPIVNARVFLVDSSLGTKSIEAPPRSEETVSPSLLLTATDAKGAYTLSRIPPTEYFLVIVTNEGPPAVVGPLNVRAGNNLQGFTRVVFDRAAPLTVQLPRGDVWATRNRSSGRQSILSSPPDGGAVSFFPSARGLIDAWPLSPRQADRRVGEQTVSVQGDERPEGGAVLPPFGKVSLSVVRVPFGRVLGQVVASNAPVGSQGALLTAYPLGQGTPHPIAVEAGSGLFDTHLPRGRYILAARSPSIGRGWIGPVSVAMSVDELRVEGVQIRLLDEARVTGRLNLSQLPEDAVDSFRLLVSPEWESLVRPWRGRSTPFIPSASGDFDLTGLGIGPHLLQLAGGESVLRYQLHTDESGLLDCGVLLPTNGLSMETAHDKLPPQSWSGRFQGTVHPDDVVRASWLKHTSIEEGLLRWEHRTSAVAAFALDDAVEGADAQNSVSLRGVLHLDGLRQMDRPYRVIGLDGWAYAHGALNTLSFIDETGQLRLDGISAQPKALSLEWRDDNGNAYRAVEFLEGSQPNGNKILKPHVDFTTAPLDVVVTRLHDGSPMPNAVVRVRRSDVRGILAQTAFARDHAEVARAVTDSRGQVQFLSLPTDTYDLEVTSDEAGRVGVIDVNVARRASRNLIEISMGDRSELLIEARGSKGQPLVHADVFCFDSFGFEVLPDHRHLTDSQGRLSLSGLGSGPLEVHIQPYDGILQSAGTVDLSRGGTARMTFSAVPTGQIQLRVETETGSPVVGASVSLGEGGGAQRLMPLGSTAVEEWAPASGRNGQVRIGPLAPGTYDVLIEATGIEPRSLAVEVRSGSETELGVRVKKH